MAPLAIVEDFDVVEDIGTGLSPRLPGRAPDEFPFQGREKAFHRGVVPAVGAPAHTALDAVFGELGPVGGAGILASPIGVVEGGR